MRVDSVSIDVENAPGRAVPTPGWTVLAGNRKEPSAAGQGPPAPPGEGDERAGRRHIASARRRAAGPSLVSAGRASAIATWHSTVPATARPRQSPAQPGTPRVPRAAN